MVKEKLVLGHSWGPYGGRRLRMKQYVHHNILELLRWSHRDFHSYTSWTFPGRSCPNRELSRETVLNEYS